MSFRPLSLSQVSGQCSYCRKSMRISGFRGEMECLFKGIINSLHKG